MSQENVEIVLKLHAGKFAGGRPVALRFTSDSDHGSWRIDNIYVDPKRL